jgi:uncharacterized protein
MIIAVMSDTHDNIWNLRKAIEIIRKAHVEAIIHCGDFVAPFMLKELSEAAVPVHGVFGNNDGDQHQLTRMSLTLFENITLHGFLGKVNLGGLDILFTHHREVAEGPAASGVRQLVCYGHSHTFCEEKIGKTVLLNPGEVMGKDGSPGFCLVNSENLEIRRVALPPQHDVSPG